MGKNNLQAYDQLCSQFYDATEKYASQEEVHFFDSLLKQYPGRILEAMSGSGRLQIPLMQRGYVVDGVDHSDAMLERCRQRCTKLGLTPELYEQSLETLSLPHKYRFVIIAVGSLQLITDHVHVLQALKKLHDHMLPGGHLFIDIFVPDATLDELSVSIARLDEHRIIRLTKRHVFNVEKKLASSFCWYELIVDGIVLQQENALIEVVWRNDNEWKELLLEAGFEIVQIYDETFKKSESSRIIHAQAVKK
jgi:SAM-dependent methyltransferase